MSEVTMHYGRQLRSALFSSIFTHTLWQCYAVDLPFRSQSLRTSSCTERIDTFFPLGTEHRDQKNGSLLWKSSTITEEQILLRQKSVITPTTPTTPSGVIIPFIPDQ
ncbi:hypothetical protein IW261DRAFT_102877 [Armillaria novae-zelandiae]|uniref:Uncharacterized protein n=1 Tax=Armillaria novae-zelandiae TaxID=153914 RepID=A0AA39PWF0_9AGAR|nr:hypothetical protein IW261DRAFT_102877 [Armillaria novae-zelandiae]